MSSANGDAPLRFDDIVVDYQRKHQPDVRAVAGVSLSVSRGQVHGLVGESGCGKSTLARAATGLIGITSGDITFEGQPVRALGAAPRPNHFLRLQMVFQDPHASLNPRRSVGDQLADGVRRATALPRSARQDRINEVLETVGLPRDAARRFPNEFSGGQRQRVSIARALVARPTVIIADEPISALDASAQAQIANLLVALAREFDLGVLLISHDLGIVRHVADVVTVMYLGKIVETASTRSLWDRPLHPYSEALLAAAPAHDGAGVVPKALPGEIPDPSHPPAGCRFNPRCKYAFARCTSEEPPLLRLGNRRASACWLGERE